VNSRIVEEEGNGDVNTDVEDPLIFWRLAGDVFL
jgi:hypothetical protein